MSAKPTAPKAGERATERRCGTCRWFERGDSNSEHGRCTFPLPDWLTLLIGKLEATQVGYSSPGETWAHSGTSCATWMEAR